MVDRNKYKYYSDDGEYITAREKDIVRFAMLFRLSKNVAERNDARIRLNDLLTPEDDRQMKKYAPKLHKALKR